MPKLLVLDKNVFEYTNLGALCDFVANYHVTLPYVLCVECLISPDRNDHDLLNRAQKLVRAGAVYTRSPFEITRREKETLSPVKSIINENGTSTIRTGTPHNNADYLDRESKTYWGQVVPIVEKLLELAEMFYSDITKKNLLHGIRTETDDNVSRLKKWAEAMKQVVDNRLLKKMEPEICSYIRHDWYTWHDYWLGCILSFEWAYQKAKGGQLPVFDKASHDFHDMQYIACLSRADGILTNDKNLVIPLAQAAFPKKDVFSSLDYVPDTYQGGWH